MDQNKLNRLYNSIRIMMHDYARIYTHVWKENDFKNSFRDIIANDIPNLFKECASIKDPYIIEGSYGKGRWTKVPWIAVFDRRITTSAQKGVYIVYLLNKDTQELYLTLNQGATNVIQNSLEKQERRTSFAVAGGSSNSESNRVLRESAKSIRAHLNNEGFQEDEYINSGSYNYDAGAIFYKKYTYDELPSGEHLVNDLLRMIKIYQQYYESLEKSIEDQADEDSLENNTPEIADPSVDGYDPKISKEKWLELLNDEEIFGINYSNRLQTLAHFYEIQGPVSSLEIDKNNDLPLGTSNEMCVEIAKSVHEVTGCPLNTGEHKYISIMFSVHEDKSQETHESKWELRQELSEALLEFDIFNHLQMLIEEDKMNMTVKEAIEKVKLYIESRGFAYDSGIVENFYLSLKSKPFTILAGTSGTGKTRLVKLFAEAIGAKYKMVSVRPDWSDSTDLFGHVDLNGRFNAGVILDFIASATKDLNTPYILCLDEMNLARVEYYLSDFLSIIETRDLKNGIIVTDYLITNDYYGTDQTARDKYGMIAFPQNLYLVGTVNMDETTFPFSKKVLDRANTIEFNYVDLTTVVRGFSESTGSLILPNSFLKTNYLYLSQCEDVDYVDGICNKLQRINQILNKANSHVGYRVRDEIVFYMLNNKDAELLEDSDAFDNEIMQKILPRIQGSSQAVKDMLCELFKEFAGDYEGFQTQTDDVSSKMMNKIQNNSALYPKSARKVAFMVRRFEEDGFTSYWL